MRSITHAFFLLLGLSSLHLPVVQAQSFNDTLYVAPTGSDTRDGRVRDRAVRTIGQALELAKTAAKPVLILVEPGTYQFDSFPLTPSSQVTLRGEGEPAQVIVDGEGNGGERLFNLVSVTDVTIENFTLRNGFSSSRGGAVELVNTTNCTLRNLVFEQNEASARGGAVYTDTDTGLRVENCTFRDNTALLGGALFAGALSTVELTASTLTSNYADSSGGALFLDNADVRLYKNRIFSNSRNPGRVEGAGGITSFQSKAIIGGSVENANDIYDNTGGTLGAQLFVSGSDVIQARYNYWGSVPGSGQVYPGDLTDSNNYRTVARAIPIGTRAFYLSPAGADTNKGYEPGSPWKTLNFALSQFFASALDSVTLNLAAGTYSPTHTGETFPIVLESYTSIVGQGESTVFDGTTAPGAPVFTATGQDNFSIRNLVVRNVDGGSMGAIRLEATDGFSAVNCLFENNSGGDGGVFSLLRTRGSSISDNRFTGNSATRGGAIMTLYDARSTIQRNVFNNNSATAGGVVLADSNSTTRYLNNYFHHNTADTGGVFYITRCGNTTSPTLNNNRLIANTATVTGAAIALDDGSQPIIGGRRGRGNDIYDNDFPEGSSQVVRLAPGLTVDARYNYWAAEPDEKMVLPLNQFAVDNFLLKSARIAARTSALFVAPDGDNENAGTSPDAPWRTLTYALQQFLANPEQTITINLAAGRYSPSSTGEIFPLQLKGNMNLYGAGADSSILDAEGTATVLVGNGLENVVLRKIAITNGDNPAGSGGGFALFSSTAVTVDSCRFAGNRAALGAALYLSSSKEILVGNSELRGNTASSSGGAGYTVLSTVEFRQNSVVDNSARNGEGGGFAAVASSHLTLLANTLEGNTALRGGAVFLQISSGIFRRNFIVHNSADFGGGIFMDGKGQSLIGGEAAEGNDVYGNTATESGAQFYLINVAELDARYNYWGNVPEKAGINDRGAADFSNYRQVSIQLTEGVRRFYLSPGGKNSNSGTADTLAMQSLNYALERVYGTPDRRITLVLQPGTYDAQSGQTFPIRLRDYVTVTGASMDDVTIDAQNSARVFEAIAVSGALLQNVTVTRGQAAGLENLALFSADDSPNGGGIRISGGENVVLESVRFRNNRAGSGYGGAVSVENGARNTAILSCELTQNSAQYGGGLASLAADSLSVRSTVFDGNSGIGGAIFSRDGFVDLSLSTVSNNNSVRPGSGLYFAGTARALVRQNKIFSNEVTNSDTGAVIAVAATSQPVIGGAVTSGNDIYDNLGGTIGKIFARMGAGTQPVLASYNYLGGEDSMTTALVLPLDQFDTSNTWADPVTGRGEPHLVFASPEPGSLRVEQGKSVTFVVYVSDFDGDKLTYVWSVNGGGVGNDTTYTLPPRPPASVDRVRVRVFDDDDNELIVEWIVETEGTVSVQPGPDIPKYFDVSPLYPNPFNPETHFRYALPRAAEVRIVVYDMQGRLVRHLLQGFQQAGVHTAGWDGRDDRLRTVSSGAYLLVVEAGTSRMVRKMMLVR